MLKIDDNHVEIRKELFYIASSHSLLSSFGLLANFIAISIAFWDNANHILLILWPAILAFFQLRRNLITSAYLKNPLSLAFEKSEKIFKIYTMSSAIIFSVGLLLLFPKDLLFHQTFLCVIVAGMAAGAAISLSVYKRFTTYYLIILILPFTYTFSIQGTKLHTLLAILMILFLIMLILFSRRYYKNITNELKAKLLIQDSQKELELSQDYFHTIFKQTPVGLFTYNTNLVIKDLNQAFATILKTTHENLLGFDMKKIVDKSLNPALFAVLKNEKGLYEGKYHTDISDDDVWINMQTVPMHDTQGNIKGGLAIVADVTQRVKSEEKIRHQAFYDQLTGLANRLTFNDYLDQELARLSRHSRYGAVLFIDIDNFKNINDSLGHHKGDLLLKTFAARASKSIRKEDMLARLGGDEFVILLSNLSDNEMQATERALHISKKLHSFINKPIKLEENSLHITISVGVTLISSQDTDINNILKHADIAMYEAKATGRNKTCFFEKEMSLKIQEQLVLDSEIRDALKNNEFELYYQPIVETKSSKIVSYEALIRWNHPTRGLVFPDAFIPYAEGSGLIVDIGNWVINTACKNHKKYNNKLKNISINISLKQFIKADFIENILDITNKYNVNPSIFKLELTESVAIDNLEQTIEKMNTLKSHGFAIAMDDFGTGYSSLSYLKNLPFDFLKIDRSFIQHILDNEDDASLVKTILTISKQFKFTVIAEGVETQEHVEFLKSFDCEYYQGYVVSKALPISKL